MPLLDHFHPPLYPVRHWESFHAAWLGSLTDSLNRSLPDGYFAEEQVHAGANVEIDVATFGSDPDDGGPATATWVPPAPAAVVPTVFADDFEARVFSTTRGGHDLVAAIELVSPANKDRPEARRMFAVKCASYLYQGMTVVVVDVVTERTADLHAEIMALFADADTARLPAGAALYAVAYRPIRRDERSEVEVWPEPLAVGSEMPTLPLWINAVSYVPLDLESTYTDACVRRRIAG